jgi:hypothetical protein
MKVGINKRVAAKVKKKEEHGQHRKYMVVGYVTKT